MTDNLHEFVPPFTLYLNAENAQNLAWKHFEKTNNMYKENKLKQINS